MLISWGNFFSFLGIWAEAPEREKRDQVLGMAGREGGNEKNEREAPVGRHSAGGIKSVSGLPDP